MSVQGKASDARGDGGAGLDAAVAQMAITDGGPGLEQLVARQNALRAERSALFREGYPVLLDVLSLADQLAAQLAELRERFAQLKSETLPHLEKTTSYEFVEGSVLAPHRERTQRLRERLREEEEARQKVVVEQSVKFLQSKISLSTCLRVVSTLKQQAAFAAAPRKLESLFLEARTKYITTLIHTNIISKRALLDDLKLFHALVSIMAEPVIDIVTQYRAVFTDLYPLSRFLLARLDWFFVSVESLVAAAKSTLVLASYWNQLVLLNTSYIPIAADFLHIIEPLFARRALAIVQSQADALLDHLHKKIGPDPLSKKQQHTTNTSPIERKQSPATTTATVANGKDLRPPAVLLAHPPLVTIANALVELFDSLRVFAVPAVGEPARHVLHTLLADLRELLLKRCPDPTPERHSLLSSFDSEMAPFFTSVMDMYFSQHQSQ